MPSFVLNFLYSSIQRKFISKQNHFLVCVITFFSTLTPFTLASAKNTLTFTNKQGVAIRGYDTVAYFTNKAAIKGAPEFQHTWNQAIWFFSKQEHLALFKASPQKYAPQYGGYCSWAAANNSLAPVNPKAFAIVDEKLYLNYNFRFHKRWLKERKKLILDADKNWPLLIEKIKNNNQKL